MSIPPRNKTTTGRARSDPARLGPATRLGSGVTAPGYPRARLHPRILHIGPGAFHRAHQVPATDAANAAGGDWGITGVSLRSNTAANALNPQAGLYTLLERGPEGTTARIMAALSGVLTAPTEGPALMAALVNPVLAVVSMTVTEKGYTLAGGRLDASHPDIAADLGRPGGLGGPGDTAAPHSAVGLVVAGLAARRAAGLAPFTPLSCDNLPDNGATLRRAVLDFAGLTDPALERWIAGNVAFPCSMVDRITPASTARTLADAARLTGATDLAAVETEPFTQWIIEDSFVAGRPDWTAGGALFVTDAAPFEAMKLRMLNGTHSLIAYASLAAGIETVAEAMADPALGRIARAHMTAAAATVPPVPGIDLAEYAAALRTRFANPAIAHRTAQIASDGSQKFPQRLLDPAHATRALGDGARGRVPVSPGAETFAFALAAWAHHLTPAAGQPVNDPRAADLARAVCDAAPLAALAALPDLLPPALAADTEWLATAARWLDVFRTHGGRAALDQFADSAAVTALDSL